MILLLIWPEMGRYKGKRSRKFQGNQYVVKKKQSWTYRLEPGRLEKVLWTIVAHQGLTWKRLLLDEKSQAKW